MTENARSRIGDLKAISLVVGITIAMGTAAWGVVSWAQSLKPISEAKSDHEVLHQRISKVDKKADEAEGHASRLESEILPTLKVLKCYMRAGNNRRSRERCGLE